MERNRKINQERPTGATYIQIPAAKWVEDDGEGCGADTTPSPGKRQDKKAEASGPADDRPEKATVD